MKKIMSLLSSAGVLMAVFWGCSDAKGRYLDLSTGEPVDLDKNDQGIVINKDTKEPLYIYVDTKKDDTIYAKTGEVINGHVIRLDNNTYVFDEDNAKIDTEDGKYKNGEYKIKVEDDGDTKIKTGDKKIKIDDGERKVKND